MNEKEWIQYLDKKLRLDKLKSKPCTGQGKKNLVLPVPFNCSHNRQFGDLRIETGKRTIVVEIESAGGIDNFLKYWPYLLGQTQTPPEKDFVLIHIYGPSYPTHKALWRFFYDRRPQFMVKAEFYLFDNGDEQKESILAKIRHFLRE